MTSGPAPPSVPALSVGGALTRTRQHAAPKIRVAAWPAAAVVAVVVSGMAYSLWWGPVVLHVNAWRTPGDLWATLRAAHVVGWGGEGILYQSKTGLVSFPGIAVLLAPVAMVCGSFGLTESFPLALPHPTAWLVVGPAEILLGGVLLFALDSTARRLGVGGSRRLVLLWAESALLWPVVAMWGHPEDPLALAFGLYGLLAAFDGRWRRCGAFFGVAIALQPLTVLMLPVAAVQLPWRKWLPTAGIVLFPTAALLVAPLAHAWATTVHALVDQPNFPSVDHATPWLALAPVLQHAHPIRTGILVRGPGGLSVETTSSRAFEIVAAGPGRLIAISCATAIAAACARGRSLVTAVWLAGLCLSLRCVFESVMDPYYLLPGLAIGLLVAAREGWLRLGAASACAAACTWWSYRHVGPWEYYVPVTLLLLGTWALAWPRRFGEAAVGRPTEGDVTATSPSFTSSARAFPA